MKIDFNENGMTINFDKVPSFLYFNEEGIGCGKAFLNGVQVKKLIDVKMHAHTRDDKGTHPLKYLIQHLDKSDVNARPDIKEINCNYGSGIYASVKITDLDVFQMFLLKVKAIVTDERIPENIKQEHINSLFEFTGEFKKEAKTL